MIFLVFVVLVLLIGFSEIGLAILLVLPLTAAALVAIASFFGMLGGIEGSAQAFFVSSAIVLTAFGVLELWSRR